jgi:hypothetical protein
VRVGLLPWPATHACVSSCSAELRSLGSICGKQQQQQQQHDDVFSNKQGKIWHTG